MPESGTYGSVRGALSNGRPYRDFMESLHQASRLPEDLARNLAAAGADQGLNDFLLMFGQHDVSSPHRISQSPD
jgi:hypothetical protein